MFITVTEFFGGYYTEVKIRKYHKKSGKSGFDELFAA